MTLTAGEAVALVRKFLKQNKSEITYVLLFTVLRNLDLRSALVKTTIDSLRQDFIQIFRPNNANLDENVEEFHVKQLELIALICMFIEDFLTYVSVLRKNSNRNIAELPEEVAYTNPKTLNKEAMCLYTLGLRKLWVEFRFPDIRQFTKNGGKSITKDERELLRQVLKYVNCQLMNRIRDVLKFYLKHKQVYNKYKHGMSVILGMHNKETVERGMEISSHIYVRSKDIYRQKPGKAKVYTYIIPVSTDTLNYYEKVAFETLELFSFIVQFQLYYFNNRGNVFFPRVPNGMMPTSIDYDKFQQLINDLDYRKVDVNVISNINLKPKRAQITRKYIRKDHIYRAPFDVFKKSKISIRSTPT
jgi:hypothetical protein